MGDQEIEQLKIMNQNLVTLAMNQAILFSEMKSIGSNLKIPQGVDKVEEITVQT